MNDKDKHLFEALSHAWENTKKTKEVARFSLDYCSQIDWLFKQIEQQQEKVERYERAFKTIVKHNELIGSKTINKIAKEILELSE